MERHEHVISECDIVLPDISSKSHTISRALIQHSEKWSRLPKCVSNVLRYDHNFLSGIRCSQDFHTPQGMCYQGLWQFGTPLLPGAVAQARHRRHPGCCDT